MGDSIVGRHSDARKTTQVHQTALSAEWSELDKKAVKATDIDITNLTKSLQSSWADVSTLSKIVCLDTHSKAKPTLEKLAEHGPVKIDAATKMAFKSGELSIENLVTKVGNLGADLVSWFFGNKETKPAACCSKPDTSKTDEPKGSDKAVLKPAGSNQEEKSAAKSVGPKSEAKSSTEQHLDQEPDESQDSQGLAASTLKGIEPHHLRTIFDKIFSKESKATALALFPDALVNSDGILFGVIENNSHIQSIGSKLEKPTVSAFPKAEKKTAGPPELKIENGKAVFSSPDKSVQLHRNSDGTIATTVHNKENGALGELLANFDGTRVYKEGMREIYKFIGKDQFTAGEFISDGLAISQVRKDKKVLVASKDQVAEYLDNMTFVSDTTAKSLQEALTNYKKAHPEAAKTDDTMMIWYQNGGALIHPSLERVLEFKRTKDGMELNYDLGNGTSLRRSPKGKLYIIDADNSVKELSDEQKKKLIDGLGAKAEVVRRLLCSMETGSPIVLPDGQEITLEDNQSTIKSVKPNAPSTDGKARKPTEILMTGDGWTVNAPEISSSFVEKTGKLITESEGKPVSIDLKSEHFDMVTSDFIRKDGEVTFVRTNVRIDRDGGVDLPDGTRINPGNDVRFADGSTLSRDGKFVSNDGTTTSVTPLPHKTNLDAIVSQAISMASSLASRAQSGCFSPSDMALLEANMSVVQNFINLFSMAGNLPMAHSLYRSWSILKETHGQAQNERGQNEAAEKMRTDEIRAFLKKLALENSQNSSRLESNDNLREEIPNAA